MMKTMLLAGLLAVAACGGNTEPVADTAQPVEHEAKHMEMKKRLDKNGDGKIEVAELPEKLREKMAKADLNKDGVLSEEEMKEARSRMHAHMKAHMKETAEVRFASKDANKDGFLTADEVDAEHWEHMKQADANNDGKLSLDELKAAHAQMKMRHHHEMKGQN
jgi:Ca2+-binding EF-hand superfamily protein